MAYNRSHARKLCSDPEFALVDASFDKQLERLTAPQLRSRVERSRKLRDKQRDLLQRQRLQTRATTGTKDGPTGDANKRTEQKEKLFDEVLGRFEARLAELERDAARKAEREASVAKRAQPVTKERAARQERQATRRELVKVKKLVHGEQGTRTRPTPAKTSPKPATPKATPAKPAPSQPAAKPAPKAAPTAAAKPAPKAAAKVAAKPAPKAAAKAKASQPAPAVEPPAPPPGPKGRFISDEAKAASRRQKLGAARSKSIQAHISSRGRRNQARRDSR